MKKAGILNVSSIEADSGYQVVRLSLLKKAYALNSTFRN